MSLENWVLSVSKYKRIALKLTDCLLTRVNVEPIEDDKNAGAKAVWVGQPGETDISINSRTVTGGIKLDGVTAPTVEYWQHGDKRGFAVRHPKSISLELDKETVSRLATPKAAGIAMLAGAAVGLLGWGVIALANRARFVRQETELPSSPTVETGRASPENDLTN